MWAQSAAEIGQIIAAARRHHKLTQAELARALGTTQGWVSEVEQGKETAQIGKVLRALSQLGVRLRTGIAPWNENADSAVALTSSSDEPISLAHIINQLSQPVESPDMSLGRRTPMDKVSQTETPKPSEARGFHTSAGAHRSRRKRTKR